MHQLPVARITEGKSPLLVTAIHAGHAMRRSLVERCALSGAERLREEDPYTDRWVDISDNQVVGLRSRFEVDLNRPREGAVYQGPGDAWGLRVWKEALPPKAVLSGKQAHDAFHAEMESCMERLLDMHPLVVVYDLHAYNHQRDGPGLYAPVEENPEINIGTGNCGSSAPCAAVVDALVRSLRAPDAGGCRHDVRRNVRFRGGHFTYWLRQFFGDRVCPIAIEFKKTFMDEWTGRPDHRAIQRTKALLERSIPPVMQAAHVHSLA